MSYLKARELLRLAILATRRQGISLLEISEEFGCVHRTAQRMTDALEEVFPAVMHTEDHERHSRWTLPSRSVAPLLSPSADELASLSAGIANLERADMVAEAANLRLLERKVRALIPHQANVRLAVDEEALLEALGYAARPGPRPAANFDVDLAISQALKGPFLLRIVYRRRDEDGPSERIVAPHGLLLGVRRYLVARDMAKTGTGLRHYRVEEIYEAEVLEQSFELDPNFNIGTHAERGFGSYENATEHGEVIWKFRADAAPHARRYMFHPTQTSEDMEDGSLVVKFRASGHIEMCWHLYAWGDAIEVLAPQALIDLVQHHRRDDFKVLP
ncbi:helix-turn-helix transcriptional regulator [Asticcacaulis sp.]|jgi:predicted DNA-binding transcriptional regulator YafY|uniref:helix-turn-helix transcriptional regulator n=1 Tax=Asticcacaulis sp. TaxID=1872648 RepID=UPI003F7B43CE